MREVRFYVGADNHTGNPQKEKLVEILNRYFPAYTLISANGYWETQPELSTVVIIHTDFSVNRLKSIAETLKTELSQDCIAMATIQSNLDLI